MMASLADSNEENLTLALRLSRLSSDAIDEQISQFLPEGSVSTNHISRLRTPTSDMATSDMEDDLALALRLSLLPSDDLNDQVTRLHRTGSAPTTPHNESKEDDLDLALDLSQLPADVFDGQVSEFNRPKESRTAVEDSLALLLTTMSVVEGDTQGSVNALLSSGLSDNTLRSALDDDYSRALTLIRQATSLAQRYENSGAPAELEEGIHSLNIANGLIPKNHPVKPACLSYLGNGLTMRFKRLGDIADIDKAIMAHQQAVCLTPDGHPDKPGRLNNLGLSLEARFSRLDDVADLNEATAAQKQAIRLTPEGHPERPMYLNNLGAFIQSRFERLGDIADLSEAMLAHQEVVRLTPDGHPQKPGRLNDLGLSLQSRFKCLGNIVDLNEAIMVQQQAVHLTPDGHPAKPDRLNNLGTSAQSRFTRLGDIADLDKAVTVKQRAVHLTPDAHPEKPMYLGSLGISIHSKFNHLGDIADLDQAITLHLQAVRLTPDSHPRKVVRLNNLGISFQSRFECLGEIADLDKAITVLQQAVRLTPDRHPGRPVYLNNLGTFIQSRFERLGDIADLDKAITAQQQAASLTPDGHTNKPMHLNNLGISFQCRFIRLGDLSDLDGAITALQRAIYLTPEDQPARLMYFNNLGISFRSRFDFLDEIADLDAMITVLQQVVRLTPDRHPRKSGRLVNLGASFRSRFERLGDIADLHKAITVQRQAVRLTPDGHPEKPRALNNLGVFLQRQFNRLGDIADFDEAMMVQQQAVHLTPDNHHDKSMYLNNLGVTLRSRLSHCHDDATFAQAISTYSQSAKSPSGHPSHRFVAAHMWGTLCFSVHSDETIEAYIALVDLIPRIVWLGRTVEQRYEDISLIGDAITDAAAAAIHLGRFDLALEWLEQGRSVVWGQMLQLRNPLDELRQYHPNEANELEKISRALDSAGVTHSDHPALSSDNTPQSLEEAAQIHRRLAEDYDRVLARIRHLAGFGEFLKPEKSASLCCAAISGPVVIVNAHKSRCDALILLPHSPQVSHVPLPQLQASVAQEMQIQLAELTRGANTLQRHYASHSRIHTSLSGIVVWLWSHIVEPVLSYLKLLQKRPSGMMPHITWCLTGPLTFLPIHAAGLYHTEDAPKIFDYVVSSYTPSLSSLLAAKPCLPKTNQTVRLLTVSQPATPGLNPLPGTVDELNAIQTLHSSTGRLHITRLDHREATVAAVLQHMKECSWIHLACHGVQDTAGPTESAFHLFDKPLTLKEVMKQSFTHTELAVLSACQTAKGDRELPEEAIHLAAGMLMAGYGSVVATMWSIRDDDGPIIAEKFYKYLIDEAGGDSSRAAYALHNAVARLRNVRGEKNFASWVPFIHLGICTRGPQQAHSFRTNQSVPE